MKTLIYMMRHGEAENPAKIEYGRLPGFPLSDLGKRHVEATAKNMKQHDLGICLIISSPIERARQTAEILSEALGVSIRTDERVTEWDQGPWEGKSTDEFSAKSGYYAHPIDMTGLEPHEHAADRIIAAVHDLIREYSGKAVIIVSHRESLASAILKLQGVDFETIHDLDMPVASVWRLDFEDSEFQHAERVW